MDKKTSRLKEFNEFQKQSTESASHDDSLISSRRRSVPQEAAAKYEPLPRGSDKSLHATYGPATIQHGATHMSKHEMQFL